jgi:hypothetical protein
MLHGSSISPMSMPYFDQSPDDPRLTDEVFLKRALGWTIEAAGSPAACPGQTPSACRRPGRTLRLGAERYPA